MKQKTYIAVLLAGMLALAGCGGGGSSTASGGDGENEDNKDMVNAFDASDCKAGTKVNDAGDGCIADTSAADEKANRAQFLALYSALNKQKLADFETAATLATAKMQDAYKQATVSMQGAKFSTLDNDALGSGVTRSNATTGSITLTTDIPAKNVVFDGVAKVGKETHDKETVVNGAAAFRVSGSFLGVDGTYTCTEGNSCTSEIDVNDALDLGGTWTFVPDNKDSRITDKDAVKYGWWTDTPPGGSLTVGLFSDKSSTFSQYAGGGTATYEGEALGQYVIDEDDHGAFTATATLTASFGTKNSIEGMIDGFKGDDGQDRADWKVVLHKSEFGDDLGNWAASSPDLAPDTGKATFHVGDAKGSVGGWQAALYGGGTTVDAPTHAAGEFFAHGQTTERIIGAFGAKAKKE